MAEMSDGVIAYRHGWGALALTVRRGLIVACEPAREWAVGRHAVELWEQSTGFGADLRWVPDEGAR